MPPPPRPERFVDKSKARTMFERGAETLEYKLAMLVARLSRIIKASSDGEVGKGAASMEILHEMAFAHLEVGTSLMNSSHEFARRFDEFGVEWVPVPLVAAKTISLGWDEYNWEKGFSLDEALKISAKRGQGDRSKKKIRKIMSDFEAAWMVTLHRAMQSMEGNQLSEDQACRHVADHNPTIFDETHDPFEVIKAAYKRERKTVLETLASLGVLLTR